MFDGEIWGKFYKYLDKSDNSWKGKPTSEIGLIKNAPIEAIEAYEEYKKWEKENSDNE